MFMLCFAIIIIILNYYCFPLHVHCIHLARGMMRMRIPSNNFSPHVHRNSAQKATTNSDGIGVKSV